jgi:hypothetical protein
VRIWIQISKEALVVEQGQDTLIFSLRPSLMKKMRMEEAGVVSMLKSLTFFEKKVNIGPLRLFFP